MNVQRWAVRRLSDGKWYNPDISGDRLNPTFADEPKLYRTKGPAVKAVEFCESGVNTRWSNPFALASEKGRKFTPVKCELVAFVLVQVP